MAETLYIHWPHKKKKKVDKSRKTNAVNQERRRQRRADKERQRWLRDELKITMGSKTNEDFIKIINGASAKLRPKVLKIAMEAHGMANSIRQVNDILVQSMGMEHAKLDEAAFTRDLGLAAQVRTFQMLLEENKIPHELRKEMLRRYVARLLPSRKQTRQPSPERRGPTIDLLDLFKKVQQS